MTTARGLKWLFTVAAFAAAARLAAVQSPLATADDYIFTTPPSNMIHGVVMGQSGSYSLMRAEDIAYLREAFNERAAITLPASSTNNNPVVHNGDWIVRDWIFGSWPPSITNDNDSTLSYIWRGTNEIVGKLELITNKVTYVQFPDGNAYPPLDPRYYDKTFYLTPDYYSREFPVRQTPALIDDTAPLTNTWDVLCVSNGVYIPPQPLTTNKTISLVSYGQIDYGDDIVSNYFARVPIKGTISTNLFALVDKMDWAGFKQITDFQCDVSYDVTEIIPDYSEDQGKWCTTNRPGTADFYYAYGNKTEAIGCHWSRESPDDSFGDPRIEYSGSLYMNEIWGDGEFYATLPILWTNATAGGVMRLSSGSLYIDAHCNHDISEHEGDGHNNATSRNTNLVAYVLLKVPIQRFSETNGFVQAYFNMSSSRILAHDALSEMGARWLDPHKVTTTGLTLVQPQLSQYDIDSDKLTIYRQEYVQRVVTSNIYLNPILLLIDCTFRTEIQE